MNLAHWLVRSACVSAGNPALLKGDTVVADYASFARSAAGIAGALVETHGVKPGDHVAIFARNCTEYLEAMWGVWFAGAAVVPVNAKLHPKEAAWIIADSGARLALVTATLGENLDTVRPDGLETMVDLLGDGFAAMRAHAPMPAPAERAPDETAWLFYTSGTTGKPKGVMITHANIQAMVLGYFANIDEVYASDCALYAAPISHGAGLYNVQHVLKAARHAVPPSGGFEPAEILDLSRRLGDVHMFAAPTMVKRLVTHAKAAGATGEGIRTIVYGGGPMYLADIIEAVDVLGPRFAQLYGQGESPMCITGMTRAMVADRTHPRWRERLASTGIAQACVEVRIAGEDGTELPLGETGEVLVRGASVMKGYWNNPDANAKTLRDGWLWTGDMGAMDGDGFLTLKDRSKDLIISGGTNIYPREVEEALLTHPSVSEVSVVGAPHPEWGEEVVAFVVLAEGGAADEKALDAHCLDQIARFKRPKRYWFIEALPKNNYGKVLKTELRTRLAEEREGA
ncbi:AMP-dependent synthetase [Zhengella mangrovi]|uniref:3-methylmercaptopropionyl-CoA ligase n=1 Tax=Zhengella mangrovi TaxID=1982044 RepID=A0A2G1QTT5_9HYPH|nr:AMP-binding protein [Zhengella mangrovi]PHP68864.1 AMP-dependent synthetase [Zhengella mangrovi]